MAYIILYADDLESEKHKERKEYIECDFVFPSCSRGDIEFTNFVVQRARHMGGRKMYFMVGLAGWLVVKMVNEWTRQEINMEKDEPLRSV
jgi:hypothetical protein